MSDTVRKHILLTSDLNKKIVDLTERNNAKSQSYIVNHALNYYFENEGIDYPKLYDVIEATLEKKLEPIKNDIEKIKLGQNSSDKGVQIILDLINHYYSNHDYGEVVPVSRDKTKQFKQAESNVEKEIAKKRQRKLSD